MDAKYVTQTAPLPEIARIDYTHQNKAGVDKTSNRINLASKYLWGVGYGDHGTEENPILFTDLTKKQKLDIVGLYLDNCINDAARTQQSVEAQETAKATAQADFDTNQ